MSVKVVGPEVGEPVEKRFEMVGRLRLKGMTYDAQHTVLDEGDEKALVDGRLTGRREVEK